MGESSASFELGAQLGASALGETFVALRESQPIGVVRRFTRPLSFDASFWSALSSELDLAAQLSLPSVAAVLEWGRFPKATRDAATSGGEVFVLTQQVGGSPLSALIRASQQLGVWPLPMPLATALLTPVLEALAAAHALSPPLLHRDLVPEHVRVTAVGQAVLLDFGLGRASLRAGANTSLRRGTVSPEQARGQSCDARSEVFAVGLMLFELVCGRLPAAGPAGEVLSRIANGELDAANVVLPALDPAMGAVLARALALRAEERFASAKEFLQALTPWASQASAAMIAQWAAPLAQVELAPIPEPVEAPSAPAPAPISAVEAPPAVATAPKPKSSRFGWIAGASAAVALMAGVGATFVLRASRDDLLLSIEEMPRALEVSSNPVDAQVFVDGVLQQEHTPTTLLLDRQTHSLVLKRTGFPSWSRYIQNGRKLEVSFSSGEVVDERYEGGPPRPPTPPPAPAVEAAAPPATSPETTLAGLEREVVFDIEAPPVVTVLNHKHSLPLDDVPTLDLAPNAVLQMVGMVTGPPQIPDESLVGMGPALTRAAKKAQAELALAGPTYSIPSWQQVNLFALQRSQGGLEVFELARPVPFPAGGKVWVFSISENGAQRLSGGTNVLVSSRFHALTAGCLLRVDSNDSFRVRVLDPAQSYRVEVTRVDGSARFPPLLISMHAGLGKGSRPSSDGAAAVLDGRRLVGGQAVLSSGTHLVTGATSLWLTLPTLEGVVPAEVQLKVEAVPVKRPMIRKN